MRGSEPPAAQPAPPLENPASVREGWKTAMIRGVKVQGAGTEKPAGQTGPQTASQDAAQEGWRTVMIRVVRGRKE